MRRGSRRRFGRGGERGVGPRALEGGPTRSRIASLPSPAKALRGTRGALPSPGVEVDSLVVVGLLLMPLALSLTLVLLATIIAWFVYGLYAAYQVYQGNDFRYWLIGERLEEEVTL